MVGVDSELDVVELVINIIVPLVPVPVHQYHVAAQHADQPRPDVAVLQVPRRHVHHVIRFRLNEHENVVISLIVGKLRPAKQKCLAF